LNDCDNVLWEIGNELDNGTTKFQYHMIRFIRETEAALPRQHPVVMTFQYGSGDWRGTNAALFSSPADAISPGGGPGQDYRHEPPAADGRKVILADTDHFGGIWGTAEWAWKSFLRGLNPVMMDPYTDVRRDPQIVRLEGGPPDPVWEGARLAMGDTRRYAERVDLARMTPRNDLASSGFCLADPGRAYLVYVPGEAAVTVDLRDASGPLSAEWFYIHRRDTVPDQRTYEGGGSVTVNARYGSDAIVYLTAQ
jgi:hypothetical protein